MADLVKVFVTMGTDHHPFDRLSLWIEHWLASGHHETVQHSVICHVQEGASPVPAGAEALGLLPKAEFRTRLAQSDIIVCQGGPGSILDARELGFVPIAVPRLARLGEVVDDHQVSFTRRMHTGGWAVAAETEEALHRALDSAVADPSSLRRPRPESTASGSAEELDRLIGVHRTRRIYPGRVPRAVRLMVTTLKGITVDDVKD
jgi:UDP-N-acetylglucosamine transferase subunit ALG13